MNEKLIEYFSSDDIHLIQCEHKWCNAYGYEKSQMKKDVLEYITTLEKENIYLDNEIGKLQQENDSLKKQINQREKLDRMRFNMVMSHYGIVKESEEMKTIEWLNKKRFDTSLTGIELNYLNILYYLILNVLEENK